MWPTPTFFFVALVLASLVLLLYASCTVPGRFTAILNAHVFGYYVPLQRQQSASKSTGAVIAALVCTRTIRTRSGDVVFVLGLAFLWRHMWRAHTTRSAGALLGRPLHVTRRRFAGAYTRVDPGHLYLPCLVVSSRVDVSVSKISRIFALFCRLSPIAFRYWSTAATETVWVGAPRSL